MGIQDILGDNFKRASVLEVNTLESLVFSWRNGKFEAKPLPSEGQWAPAFGVCIADLNGDGAEDVFLSQNFFAVGPFESRCDAGRGLLLLGNGLGELSPMPGSHSGIEVYGEQRGCALSDYDGDGRVDLAVAQNGNATKLYHNVGATPVFCDIEPETFNNSPRADGHRLCLRGPVLRRDGQRRARFRTSQF